MISSGEREVEVHEMRASLNLYGLIEEMARNPSTQELRVVVSILNPKAGHHRLASETPLMAINGVSLASRLWPNTVRLLGHCICIIEIIKRIGKRDKM